MRRDQTARSRRESFAVHADGARSSLFHILPHSLRIRVFASDTLSAAIMGLSSLTGQRRSSSTPSSRQIQLKSYGGVPSFLARRPSPFSRYLSQPITF